MCLFPTRAQSQEFGKPKPDHEGDLVLPCGKRTECISKRAIEWATRARHEISTHPENCFLTLTYNNENLPSIHAIKYEFQNFIKRLRKKLKQPIRYMVSHEYGSQNFRPHHHAIIFGWNPPDQIFLETTKSGEKIFRSKSLESLWTHGYSSIGIANERTAYYIASYSLKGKTHTLTDPHTMEIIKISDCMDASKRPAIGYNYFVANQKQLVQSNQILPRYYLKRLLIENPTLHELYENERSLKLKTRSDQELYSKFVNDNQKLQNSEFRDCNQSFEESTQYKNQLTYKRDNSHRKNKEKSNA